MRGLLEAGLFLAPALVGAVASQENTPSAFITVGLPQSGGKNGNPFLTVRLDVLESSSACGSPNVTLNGEPLSRDGRRSLPLTPGFAGDEDTDNSGVAVVSWESDCISWGGQDREQLMVFRVASVNGMNVEGGDQTGSESNAVSIRFRQTKPVRIVDVEGAANVFHFNDNYLSLPSEGSTENDDHDLESAEFAAWDFSLAQLHHHITLLHHDIRMREKYMLDRFGTPPSSGRDHRFGPPANGRGSSDVNSFIGSVFHKVTGTAKALYGDLFGDDELPHHRPNWRHGRPGRPGPSHWPHWAEAQCNSNYAIPPPPPPLPHPFLFQCRSSFHLPPPSPEGVPPPAPPPFPPPPPPPRPAIEGPEESSPDDGISAFSASASIEEHGKDHSSSQIGGGYRGRKMYGHGSGGPPSRQDWHNSRYRQAGFRGRDAYGLGPLGHAPLVKILAFLGLLVVLFFVFTRRCRSRRMEQHVRNRRAGRPGPRAWVPSSGARGFRRLSAHFQSLSEDIHDRRARRQAQRERRAELSAERRAERRASFRKFIRGVKHFFIGNGDEEKLSESNPTSSIPERAAARNLPASGHIETSAPPSRASSPNPSLEQEIAEFRVAADVVDQMIAAEEGRVVVSETVESRRRQQREQEQAARMRLPAHLPSPASAPPPFRQPPPPPPPPPSTVTAPSAYGGYRRRDAAGIDSDFDDTESLPPAYSPEDYDHVNLVEASMVADGFQYRPGSNP